MTEQSPETQPEFIIPTLNEEEAEIRKLELQLEKKRIEVERSTEFGLYDNTPSNEHEMHAREYFAQRPSEGIIREGDKFVRTGTNKFASREAYEAQNGSAQDYYDQLAETITQKEHTELAEKISTYEAMNLSALTMEAGKALLADNTDEFNLVRTAAENKLAQQALDNEEAAKSDESVAARHSGMNAEEQFVEGLKDFDTRVEAFVTRKTDKSEPMTTEETLENTVWVTDPANEPAFASSEASEFIEATVVGDPLLEIEAAQPGTSEDSIFETTAIPTEEAESKETVREKAGKWWGKHKDKFGVAYWAAQWSTARHGFIEANVTPEMNEEDAEKTRKKNRRDLIIGASVIGGSLIGLAILGGWAATHDNSWTSDLPQPDGGLTPSEEDIADRLTPDAPADGGEVMPEGPETLVGNEAFDIPEGGGGEQLFNSLQIETSKWYDNQNTLLSNFPGDFYRMDDGNVGLAHPGWLSTEAQQFISTLK